MSEKTARDIITREVALFVVLLFFGFVLMPIAMYWLGQQLLGDFGGAGYGDFYGTLSGKFRRFDLATWFLVLSPWLVWQVLRLTLAGWRRFGKPGP